VVIIDGFVLHNDNDFCLLQTYSILCLNFDINLQKNKNFVLHQKDFNKIEISENYCYWGFQS
jgi:hypothetical protein